jgi:TPR repeat protein
MNNQCFPKALLTAGLPCLVAAMLFVLTATLNATDVDFGELKTKAEQGEASAQHRLGLMYWDGQGVGQDMTEAVKWFRKAAKQGHAEAQERLGYAYESGHGITKDFYEWFARRDKYVAEAVKWYRKAAEQGNAEAQYQLGNLYNTGEGVRKNPAEGASWFRKCFPKFHKDAEQGDARAQVIIGGMYLYGDGVRKDWAEAAIWFSKAAEQGDRAGQGILGQMYRDGRGVPKNNVQAYKWFNLVAAQGVDYAAEQRRLIETQMTPEQIAEAQRLTARFVPRRAGAGASPETNGAPPQISASATAFFVTVDGYALTCYHVVKKAVRIQLMTSIGVLSARLAKADAETDIALLKVSGKFTALPLQPSSSVELGETVFTVGFPNITLQGLDPKLTEGKISSLSGVRDNPRYFQISVSIQPGNSGGALVNSKGNVVGMVAAKLSEMAALATSGSLPENVNYAIKSSYALSLLESVPEATSRLKEANTRERKFEDLVKEVQAASTLVIVEE